MSRAALLACALAAGCLDGASTYTCDPSHLCDSGHTCVEGRCAASDSGCPSGMRYDDTAGSSAGKCTATLDMNVDPNCGNGVIDPGEQCDDGQGSPTPCPQSCDDGNPCTVDVMMGAPCHQACYTAQGGDPNGTACQPDGGAAGVCENHQCCTGCYTGSLCLSGQEPSQCGSGGASCAACTGGDCTTAECQGGSCKTAALPSGAPCDGGTCGATGCCAGCLEGDGGVCKKGDTMLACGAGGVDCAVCTMGPCVADGGTRCANCVPSCTNKVCGSDGCAGSCGICKIGSMCVAGACVCQPIAMVEMGDTACGNGIDDDCNGAIDCADDSCKNSRCAGMARGMFCDGASHKCTFGCRIGGVLIPNGTPDPMNPCQQCDATIDDSAWTPVPDKQSCLNGMGKCRAGTCCTTCWDSAGACVAKVQWHSCGRAGDDCVDCFQQKGGCGDCSTGQCNQQFNDGDTCQPKFCVNSNATCQMYNCNALGCEFQQLCTMGDCTTTFDSCCVCLSGRCAIGQ